MPNPKTYDYHHRRRRLGRLRAGQSAERGQGQAVLLLEAGGWDRDPLDQASRWAGRASCSSGTHDWHVFRRGRADDSRPAASNARAARSSAARRRSTPWPMCAAIAAITTAGPPSGLTGMVLCACAAVFPAPGSSEGGADVYRGGDGPLDDAD